MPKPPPLKVLMTKVKSHQCLFNNICTFVDQMTEDTTANQLTVRLSKLDGIWDSINEVLNDIEIHEEYPEGDQGCNKQRTEYGDRYYDYKAKILDQLKEFEEVGLNVSERAHGSSTHNIADHARLPQIKLQTFDGNIDEWFSFRDLYTSLIHLKADLPDVEKFHYLKGCLAGEAKSLIDPLAITNTNYAVAWKTLTNRYNDSKLLKRRQVQNLFKLPSVPKESASDLQSLLEGFERVMQTLDQIIQPADYKDLLLMEIVCSRLDPITRRCWEEQSANKEQDKVKDLVEFLQTRIKILGSLSTKPSEPKREVPKLPLRKPPLVRSSHNAVQNSGLHCIACSESHLLFQCPAFQRMSVSSRDKLIRSHLLCRNCFRRGHQANECSSKFVCRKCKGKHHTLLCFHSENNSGAKGSSSAGESSSSQSSNTSSSNTSDAPASSAVSSNMAINRSSPVLLATAVVLVEDDVGITYPARALLDSGSECNFMAERLCQRLKIKRKHSNIDIVGIGQTNMKVKHRIEAKIKSRVSGFSQTMEFLILPNVTSNLPTTTVQRADWRIPQGVELADPSFFESNAVDLVIGIQHFFDLIKSSKISLGNGLPTLNESVFGWIVSGVVSDCNTTIQKSCYTAISTSLEELMSRFWSCEELETTNNYSPEEERCEEHFKRTVQRSEDGRYTVSYPRNEDELAKLGKSRDIALRRFLWLERRLERDPELRKQYNQFILEYEQLGHMRKVDTGKDGPLQRCFLPHHPVIKEDSTTTKVRVVFNASSKTSSGTSLNDALLVGPVIQDDLRSIILRSRTLQIMLIADVEKMFRQILMCLEDLFLQSILWRADPRSDIQTYELTTVTYGTKPAPYLATRTLQQLAEDEQFRFPMAARAVKKDVYMDDVLTGADTEEEAMELQNQLDSMLSKGGFMLRKWASNCPKVLEGILPKNLAIAKTEGISLDPDPSVKTLGLVWLPVTDHYKFRFKIGIPSPEDVLSKQKVLSIIASLFDPLGLIGAVILRAKIFMQLLWTLEDEEGNRLDWDQPLPPKVFAEWQTFHHQLPRLNELVIQRCIIIPRAVNVQLHIFSDASERAYGTCAYLRSENQDGKILVALLTSRSKVAPLKRHSIPRLELCGALLSAQLSEKILAAIKLDMELFFWSDSTCALQWIKGNPSTWTTFVSNRVAKIQRLSENYSWYHVPGVDNPADLISRGIGPDQIQNCSLWWEGPSWLKEAKDQWPNVPAIPSSEDVHAEVRATAHCIAEKPESFIRWYISKSSSYTNLLRRTAIWRRLIQVLRKDKQRQTGFLMVKELQEAEAVIVRQVQQEEFPSEWRALSRQEAIARSSSLRWFNPKLSRDNLIRVGGRLGHSQESDDAKNPIVLPARHPLTRMLIEHYHHRLLHAGPQLLLAAVRQKYWPLGGRSVVRNIVHNCQRCFRVKPTAVQQFMGELPAARVTVARPFSKVGVDYFGPVYIRPGPRRTAVKGYVALFVCMCTKAVHLELVSDLSTNRFIQAFRRFIGRRGCCSDVYSDNGTNFVGARNQLQQLFDLLRSKDHCDMVIRDSAQDGIQWHFNPPAAPHFGGLWEAAVRSAKLHILKVIGDSPASIEDFTTLLVQVEACLNSRPITALSDDPNDLEPLTPGHFLIGTSLRQLPDTELQHIPTNRLNHFQVLQQKVQIFWRRWRTEYLSQLQNRTKRWKPPVEVTVGKLVVLKDENSPPTNWKLGRITEVHPGGDGVVRVVTVKTATGHLKRPVEKICLLPPAVQPSDEESQS